MFNKTVCLLLSGRAGVGKTTCAQYLSNADKQLVSTTASFAAGIKLASQMFLGWDGQKDERGRKLLQDLGKVGREYDADTWVKFTMLQYLPGLAKYPFDLVIVDDWRFINEFNYIDALPLYVVYRARIYAPGREILRNTDRYNDISETSLPEDPFYYDYVVNNSSSITELHFQLDSILDDIKFKHTYGGIK